MSTFPLDQNPPPPPMAIALNPSVHHGGGSVGPLIGVLSILAVLGIISAMIGRLCAGGRVFGHGPYDVEGWIETKCASCIDGRLEPVAPPPSSAAAPVVVPVEASPPPAKSQQAEQIHRTAAEEP